MSIASLKSSLFQSRAVVAICAALAGAGTVAQSEWSWLPWSSPAATPRTGRVLAWGRGHGKTPAPVPGIPDATAVAVGGEIGAAVGADGSVYAFSGGRGGAAQRVAGAGSACSVAVRSDPAQVIFLDAGGTVRAVEMRGDGAFAPARALAGAMRSKRITSVKCGRAHCVAVGSDGKAFAWGSSNSHGQLGNGCVATCPGGRDPEIPAKVDVPEGRKIVQADCGDRHTILLDDKGVVYGAGDDKWTQLGRTAEPWVDGQGEPNGAVEPAHLITDLPVSAVACGGQHTVVLVRDGTIFSFGYNAWGQLGHHNYSTFAPPSPLADLALRAVAISAGDNHTCALQDGGELRCIGANESGQLGVGSLQPSMRWKYIKTVDDLGRRNALYASVVALGSDMSAVIAADSTTPSKAA